MKTRLTLVMLLCCQGETRRVRASSLVEVMIAAVILSVLAIAGGSYLTHSRASAAIQSNRRIAVETGNRRLEMIRAADFEDIAPIESHSVYYLARDNDNWQVHTQDPQKTVTIQGRDYPIVTTVQYQDRDGGFPTYDYLDIRVKVNYRVDSDESVSLQTARSRWE